jgi:hypothetical protein
MTSRDVEQKFRRRREHPDLGQAILEFPKMLVVMWINRRRGRWGISLN